MSLKVLKFTLHITDLQIIEMPAEAKLLTVQMQNGLPRLWALCEENNPASRRKIAICGTGHEQDGGAYISSFNIDGGALVFHVFEVL